MPNTIYVNSRSGSDYNDGSSNLGDPRMRNRGPLRTADMAFSRLGSYWTEAGGAKIIFAPGEYPVSAEAVYFGSPLGAGTSSLVISSDGPYSEDAIEATSASDGNSVDVTGLSHPYGPDGLMGTVLERRPIDPRRPAVSIRGNTDSTIYLQRSIGSIRRGDGFVLQRPSVTLVPSKTLSLISHDGRSPNLKLSGIRIAPAPGQGLNFLNVRALCETCEFSFQRDPDPNANPVRFFVHTNSRVQGGYEDEGDPRAQAGVYINSNDASNLIAVTRGGILTGHLTFKEITVRASQGGWFVPKSLEALESPILILTGGCALAESQKVKGREIGGWGTESNRGRIRNVSAAGGDGIRVANGGSINSSLAPINLNISGCARDGIQVDMGSFVSFGPPGGATGLITPKFQENGRFGINVRNGSRAYVGADTALRGTSTAMRPLADISLDGTAYSWEALVTPRLGAMHSVIARSLPP